MKRIKFQFQQSGYGNTAREFVTPELSEEEADRLLVILGRSRQVNATYMPGDYTHQVFVAEPIDGFSVQAVEPELVMPKSQHLAATAERQRAEAEAAKKKAQEIAAFGD